MTAEANNPLIADGAALTTEVVGVVAEAYDGFAAVGLEE